MNWGIVLHYVRAYYDGIEIVKNIKIKWNFYRDLNKNGDGMSFEKYKLAKKYAKKAFLKCKR